MKSKILVVGATGLLGRAVFKELKKSLADAAEVVGTGFSRSSCSGVEDAQHLQFDVSVSCEEVSTFLTTIKPDVIVYSAAIRNPEGVSQNYALANTVNVTGLESVCKYAESVGAWVLYYSTDYVFDGTSPPYKPDDSPNPLSDYGKLKVAGETIARKYGYPVLRVPILYGQVECLSESAVTVLFSALLQQRNLRSASSEKSSVTPAPMSHYHQRCPTHCDSVASVTKQMIAKHLNGVPVTGIYHWSQPQVLTKYQIAVAMGDQFGMPAADWLAPVEAAPSNDCRPHDARLDVSSLTELIGPQPAADFHRDIKLCLEPFFK